MKETQSYVDCKLIGDSQIEKIIQIATLNDDKSWTGLQGKI